MIKFIKNKFSETIKKIWKIYKTLINYQPNKNLDLQWNKELKGSNRNSNKLRKFKDFPKLIHHQVLNFMILIRRISYCAIPHLNNLKRIMKHMNKPKRNFIKLEIN